jgi:hypothetical protein
VYGLTQEAAVTASSNKCDASIDPVDHAATWPCAVSAAATYISAAICQHNWSWELLLAHCGHFSWSLRDLTGQRVLAGICCTDCRHCPCPRPTISPRPVLAHQEAQPLKHSDRAPASCASVLFGRFHTHAALVRPRCCIALVVSWFRFRPCISRRIRGLRIENTRRVNPRNTLR